MTEITGLWAHDDGHRVAVQLDEDSILITDYAFDPPVTTPVVELDGDGWTEQAERRYGDS